MVSVNKLGIFALSRLAKKFKATVEYHTDEIPFDKEYKSGSTSFHPASCQWGHSAFLWDWEFGLVKLTGLGEDPIGLSIKGALTLNEEPSEYRTETSRASHLAILSYNSSDSGDGFSTENRVLHIYRFHIDKLNEWLKASGMTEKGYNARLEHHR